MGKSFASWLAAYLESNESDVEKLLRDLTATEFLISWSIFESECFGGFCRTSDLDGFSKRMSALSKENIVEVKEYVDYFHLRYQNIRKCNNLLHNQTADNFKKILAKERNELTNTESTFLILFVIYRFRNNIFHGNKGVPLWLTYKKQIHMCSKIMHYFVNLQKKLGVTC